MGRHTIPANLNLLSQISDYFKVVRTKYGQFDNASSVPDANVLRYQIPGGMISNFISQLKEQKQIDKLPAVFAEVPRVKADMGHPPLVTPTSQIVGTQAVFNVLLGERYKIATNEVKDYFRGLYGKPPTDVNLEIQRKVIGDEQPITDRPADHIEPALAKAKEELGALYTKPEDVLSYALFPPQAKKFLEERLAKRTGVDQQLLEQSKKNSPTGYAPV